MDSAYDAVAIYDQSRALGHAPIVDRNFRADHETKAEWGREVERLKLIHMPDFDDAIYDFRTMAERVNARLILARAEHHLDRIAESVDERVNLGAQSAARAADGLRTVFFWRRRCAGERAR
jgi:hypothetical protein